MYTNRTKKEKKSRNPTVISSSTSEFVSKDNKYTMRPSYYVKGVVTPS
jgi:hypothetical protein